MNAGPAATLPRRLAGSSWLLAGVLIAWAVLGWRAEAARSAQMAGEQGELLRRLSAAEDRAEEGERTRRELERKLLASELAREQGRKALAELGSKVAPPPAPATASEPDAARRDRELQELRQRQELLARLNQAVRRTGADWLRFLEIGATKGQDLLDVRLLTTDESGVVDGAFSAARCRIELDRAGSLAKIALHDVLRIEGRSRSPRQTEHTIEFEPIDPRAFEVEMQPFVVASGEWPRPAERPMVTPGELESLALMRDRLASLLAGAIGSQRMHVYSLGRVADGAFHEVEILGYTAKGRLERRLRAKRLEVWVDLDTGSTELRLHDGLLEDATSRIGFPADRPYRLPLAGIAGKDAEQALTGYVQTFRSLPGQR